MYFVYAAIEAEFERHRDHPVIGKLYFPELWRERALERDLAFYYGTNWREQVQPSPACEDYLERIRTVSDTEPELPEELSEDQLEDEPLTARFNRMIEAMIRRRPEQWLWYHDRWRDLREKTD